MRLLDLYCGAGGAAVGYHRAGFDDIVGVDIQSQLRYPFEFVQDDALAYVARHGHEFDAIHASPPCQRYSWSARRWREIERADLIEPTRQALEHTGRPFIIENVIGAPLARQVLLCGAMFGLRVLRHRMFESNVLLLQPRHPQHRGRVTTGDYVTVAGHGGDNVRGNGSRAIKRAAMGIDWMTDRELNEAIPPAYTEFLGRQLLACLDDEACHARVLALRT